jgi:hypothetical protein
LARLSQFFLYSQWNPSHFLRDLLDPYFLFHPLLALLGQ